LTGVLGLSGSGKSSLLNILSGFVRQNISGELQVNFVGKKCFIMQQENLHDLLNVEESMMFASHLKTGSQMKHSQKKEQVRTILNNLGLLNKSQTPVSRLSGGQQKRLSIAQELVDNPSILFRE
jgi:ABC-type multidrug transport system ATPase subunit